MAVVYRFAKWPWPWTKLLVYEPQYFAKRVKDAV